MSNCTGKNPTFAAPACQPGIDQTYDRNQYCCDIDLSALGQKKITGEPITMTAGQFEKVVDACKATECKEGTPQMWYDGKHLNFAKSTDSRGSTTYACKCTCPPEHCNTWGDTKATCAADPVTGKFTCTCDDGYSGPTCNIRSNTSIFGKWSAVTDVLGTCTINQDTANNYPSTKQSCGNAACNTNPPAITQAECAQYQAQPDPKNPDLVLSCCTWTPAPTCKIAELASDNQCNAAGMGNAIENAKCPDSGCTVKDCCSPKPPTGTP